MADEVTLVVGGFAYGGWKSVRVTRSIESIAGSFHLEVSDRWAGQDEPWPVAEEDACQIRIGDEVVIDGYVDRRAFALAGQQRSLTYSGRDRAAALVDCSVVLDRWAFRDATVLDVARKVAEPFGITVSLQPGLVLPKAPRKLVISPGDTAFEVIRKAAESTEVLIVSDGAGGIVLTEAGTGRAAALVEGENILGASVDYDASERFSRYVVATQVAGTDEASGAVTRIRAEATDEGVRRPDRVLLIRPASGLSIDYARQRADWEARVRAARAEAVTVVVQGWTQPDGALWPLNALTRVRCPGIGVDGDLLISELEHSLDSEGGAITQLRLVRPDAFTPERRAAKVKSAGGGWKELAGGAR